MDVKTRFSYYSTVSFQAAYNEQFVINYVNFTNLSAEYKMRDKRNFFSANWNWLVLAGRLLLGVCYTTLWG